jgi:hypothetical protein
MQKQNTMGPFSHPNILYSPYSSVQFKYHEGVGDYYLKDFDIFGVSDQKL